MPLQLLHADGDIVEQVAHDDIVKDIEQQQDKQQRGEFSEQIGKEVDRLLRFKPTINL